ncbi:MAG: BMP family ABC transporter substrate-binding protein [Spirochaetaceae bacterium]|jgi:simple sugar transport system substrate-binding protein|nr:BMP family ABC transporter substrate-binding protein [Spirochaetaceae bacterium]
MKRLLFRALVLGVVVVFALACKNKEPAGEAQTAKAIGVFVPGVSSGSPVYEMLVEGVLAAAEQYNAGRVTVTVIEGGYNQAEWENKITAMTASGSYNLIVSSNPSLPDIVSKVSEQFPDQHFLLLDGEMKGNSRVYTLRYNQREQAYMAGYIAALQTETEQNGAQRRIGLVAAQEYPVMNNIILPGFLEGARAVHSSYEVDFRIVGNWYDAAKAGELAADMIQGGVRALLCIAGGANEGVVNAANRRNAKVVWFDSNGYNVNPGTVIGSSVIRQDIAACNQVLRYLEGALPFGSAEVMGVNDGYVDFIQDDPVYLETVPAEIREKQAAMIERIRSGALALFP